MTARPSTRSSAPPSSALLVALAAIIFAAARLTAQDLPAQVPPAQDRTPPEDPRIVVRRAQAQFENFRRANLPSYRGGRSNDCQERVGRFCYWYDSLAPDAEPEAPQVSAARDRLITLLDSMGTENPADNWIIAQRIRYLNEAHRDSAAYAVAMGCQSFGWWCDALEGFTLHALHRYAEAETAFDKALDGMHPSERCTWRDLSLYLDEDARKIYSRIPCGDSARLASEDRIWWYARTRYAMAGNDSRTEHFSRLTYTEFLRDAPSAHMFGFDGDERELLLRFGWPRDWSRGPPVQQRPLGAPIEGPTYQIIGHDPTPSYRFIPPHYVLTSPTVSDSTDWAVQLPPVVARYHPPYAVHLEMLEHQQALFRRGDSALVVLAYDVSKIARLAGEPLQASLVLMPGRDLVAYENIREHAPPRGTLTVTAPWGALLMSAEVEAEGVSTLVRARYGVRPPYSIGTRVSLSDLLFYQPYGEVPTSVQEVLPHALATQRLRARDPLGVYWEAYNTDPAGETMTITLTVVQETEEASIFRRGARALRLSRASQPVSVSMEDLSARGTSTSVRAVQVDISTLRPGEYLVQLEVSVAGQYTIRADRRIVVIAE